MTHKQLIIILLIAFFVGALGSIFFTEFLIPRLSLLPHLGFLSKFSSNMPIIINRKEETIINEGANLIALADQAGSFTVGIYQAKNNNYKFLGNGVIMTSDGLIFSSRSVLGQPGTLVAMTSDGTVYPVTPRAIDPRSDLVAITIQANGLSQAQFAPTSSLKVGQRILALGKSSQPFDHKFASGLVTNTLQNNSSLERVFYSEAFEEGIETDAPITSDFIGGPVINLDGKMIGLVVNADRDILISEDLQTGLATYLKKGKFVRPALGLKYLKLSKNLAKLKGFDSAGALVVSVDDGSPARLAGLMPNDLIAAVDDQSLDSNSFEELFNKHEIGDMNVSLIRNQNKINLTVKLQAK